MNEHWLPVVGYEGLYEVSDFGRVRSLSRKFLRANGMPFTLRGRILKNILDTHGYPKVELWKDGKQATAKIHRAVMRAFVGPRPTGMEILHGDGDPTNCRLANLRYGTRLENIADSFRHGAAVTGERVGTSRLKVGQVRRILESPQPSVVLAVELGVSYGHVRRIKRGEQWVKALAK